MKKKVKVLIKKHLFTTRYKFIACIVEMTYNKKIEICQVKSGRKKY